MGSKSSKTEGSDGKESGVALPQIDEKSIDSDCDPSPSFSRRFRSSCKNWATKNGFVKSIEPGKSEPDSDGAKQVAKDQFVVVEEIFEQEVAYTCGEIVEESDSKALDEVELSEVIKHLVIEAQKKKSASRPNSRIFTNVTDNPSNVPFIGNYYDCFN